MKASRRHQSRPRAPWRYSYYVLKLELLAVERYVHCPDCEPSRYLGGRPVSLQTERLSDRLTVESTNFNIHLPVPPRYQYVCTYSQVGTFHPSEHGNGPGAPVPRPETRPSSTLHRQRFARHARLQVPSASGPGHWKTSQARSPWAFGYNHSGVLDSAAAVQLVKMWGMFDFNEHIPVPFSQATAVSALYAAFKGGMGMFCQAYVLFAIGLLPPLFRILYPSCFVSSSPCLGATLASTYLEMCGIIIGMLVMGVLADRLGRQWGSRVTAAYMLTGSVIIVVAFGGSILGQFSMFDVGLFVFCFGVGGEYPLASSSAAERAEAGIKLQRGRIMVLTFSMQAWGNFINTIVFCILLLATDTGGCTVGRPCSSVGLEVTWRVQYAIGALFIAAMVYIRQRHLAESKMWLERHKVLIGVPRRAQINSATKFRHLMTRAYLPRLIGASSSWFFWNLSYYGIKMFQATILVVLIGPYATLMDIMRLALLNNFVGLVGIHASLLVIDSPRIGRTRLQGLGFFMSALLLLLCGFLYDILSSPGNAAVFQALYLLSTFFAEFGADATTW